MKRMQKVCACGFTIVMTGDVGEAGQRALKASAYPILHKPVRPARLHALVTQLLRSSREKIRAAD